DYNRVREKHKRVKLQETLANVSRLLNESNGDAAILKQHGGIKYDKYTNKGNIDHFRITQSVRVSCVFSQGKLNLYHYGEQHDDINNNPY
ncbi:MAG: CRISPR-associated protein, partial [Rivularia sp. (in: cyanobacteria)]